MRYLYWFFSKLKYQIQILYLYLIRNKIVLFCPEKKVKKHKISLNYYEEELPNLGDSLSPVIVEYMLKQKGLSLDSRTACQKNLYAVGSILFSGYQDATVWGSGLLRKPPANGLRLHTGFFRKLDIRCVRGPLTRAELRKRGFNCPAVYGDPACLMPLIYTPNVEKKIPYLVIPHFTKEEELRKSVPAECLVSMITKDYKDVIDKICSAKRVISSSLHGIILAEVYGVPAIFYNDRANRFDFKYEDWYHSTGRTKWPVATSIEEAMAMKLEETLPDFTELQKQLMESFPYDLWEV